MCKNDTYKKGYGKGIENELSFIHIHQVYSYLFPKCTHKMWVRMGPTEPMGTRISIFEKDYSKFNIKGIVF